MPLPLTVAAPQVVHSLHLLWPIQLCLQTREELIHSKPPQTSCLLARDEVVEGSELIELFFPAPGQRLAHGEM